MIQIIYKYVNLCSLWQWFWHSWTIPLANKVTICHNEMVKKTAVGKPAQWLIEAAKSVGLDFAELTHQTTDHFKTHALGRHGDPSKHGAATITEADFGKISAIVEAPDMAIIGAVRREGLFNVYIKIEGGTTYLYFEEILNSSKNRALRSVTLYKVTRPLTLEEVLKNVTGNRKTDISKAFIYEAKKNVQTAGGRPGEEA